MNHMMNNKHFTEIQRAELQEGYFQENQPQTEGNQFSSGSQIPVKSSGERISKSNLKPPNESKFLIKLKNEAESENQPSNEQLKISTHNQILNIMSQNQHPIRKDQKGNSIKLNGKQKIVIRKSIQEFYFDKTPQLQKEINEGLTPIKVQQEELADQNMDQMRISYQLYLKGKKNDSHQNLNPNNQNISKQNSKTSCSCQIQ